MEAITRSPQHSQGFNLLELMLVISIVSLLSIAAVPKFSSLINRIRIYSASTKIRQALYFSKHLAMSKNTSVTLCPRDKNRCGTNWHNGLLIMGNKEILRYFPAFNPTLNVSWRSSFGRNKAIYFTNEGFTQGQQGSFTIYNKRKPQERTKIILLQTGRIRVT